MIVFSAALSIFAADFLIKSYLRVNYPFQSIPVIRNVFHITVIFNKGAAFGIMQGQMPFLIFSSLILIVLFVAFMKNENKTGFSGCLCYGLILGGALSNLYDRLIFGYVVDYLDFRVWPVFNLSDSCISVGIGIMLWRAWQEARDDKKNNKSVAAR